MAKQKKISVKKFKTLLQSIIARHGRVRVTFMSSEVELPCDCLCKTCKKNFDSQNYIDLRRRVIDKKGNCLVQYRSDGYKTFSRYEQSCFMDSYLDGNEKCSTCGSTGTNCWCSVPNWKDVKKNLKTTIEYMLEHDADQELVPVTIEYGKGYKRKVKL